MILCWMAFPQWQPGLSSEQTKFALGLKRPTITLTSVQTRLNVKVRFWIFMMFMSIFGRFFFFFSHIDFLCQNFFFLWMFMKFKSIFERFFFFWVIYWFFISYSMAQSTSTEVLRILRPRTERINYLDYLDCLKILKFLINVCIFPVSKSANWYLKLKHFFYSHQVCDFFRKNTLLELYNAFWKIQISHFVQKLCIV